MKVEDFHKLIDHLTQEEALTIGLDTVTRLLVEKNIVSVEELQAGFMASMKDKGLEPPAKRRGKK